MGSSNHHQELKIEKFETPQALNTAIYVSICIGLLGLIYGFAKDPERLWTSYLVSFFFYPIYAKTFSSSHLHRRYHWYDAGCSYR